MVKRKRYSVQRKREVLQKLAENHNNVMKTARELDISEKCLRRWRKQTDELEGTKNPRTRTNIVYKKKLTFGEIDEKMKAWFLSERKAKRDISQFAIQVRTLTNL